MFKQKPSEAELEKRREVLRARGVPEAFVEALATRHSSWLPYKLKEFLVMLLSIGLASAISLAAVHYWPLVCAWRAHQLDLDKGAWLFSYSDQQVLSFIGVMIGLFSAPTWAWHAWRRPRPHPAPNDAVHGLRTLTRHERRTQQILKISPALAATTTELEFLTIYTRLPTKTVAWLTLVPFAIAGVSFFVMADNYWVLRGDQIMQRSYGVNRTYSLKDVRLVHAVCKGEFFIYRLDFQTRSIDLDDAQKYYTAPVFMDRLEAVHHKLTDLKIPFEWQRDQSQIGTCLQAWTAKNGTNEQRLRKLIPAPGMPVAYLRPGS